MATLLSAAANWRRLLPIQLSICVGSHGPDKTGSPESVGAGKAVGDEAAGAAAGAVPWTEVGLGTGAVLALPPGDAVGEAEHLGVGKTALFIALQDDAAATGHQRDVVELDDQHFTVVADKRHSVAPLAR